MTDGTNRALKAAEFFDAQIDLWQRNLPIVFGPGHWHIISFVRPYGNEGVSLKRVFHFVAGIFGMDSATCNKRLRDLFDEGLLTADEEPLKKGTQISATAKLIEKYDAQGVELANLMISVALPDTPKPMVTGLGGPSLNDRLDGFNERLTKLANSRIEQFLRSRILSLAIREKAMHCLQTYTYSRIFSMAWRDRAEGGNFLLNDDFHMKIFPITRKGASSTRDCLQDLIDWGFLERMNQSHGVKFGRFAVRITDHAFELLGWIYERACDEMVAVAQDLVSKFASGIAEDPTVVPITRSAPRNVSATSMADASAISSEILSLETPKTEIPVSK
jgi:hypothetical protein